MWDNLGLIHRLLPPHQTARIWRLDRNLLIKQFSKIKNSRFKCLKVSLKTQSKGAFRTLPLAMVLGKCLVLRHNSRKVCTLHVEKSIIMWFNKSAEKNNKLRLRVINSTSQGRWKDYLIYYSKHSHHSKPVRIWESTSQWRTQINLLSIDSACSDRTSSNCMILLWHSLGSDNHSLSREELLKGTKQIPWVFQRRN